MRISKLAESDKRYVVATCTPDGGRSTYVECWGSDHAYDARAVGFSDHLGDAVLIAENYGRWATIIDRKTGRPVGRTRLSDAAISVK